MPKQLLLFEEPVVPIPECSPIVLKIYGTPEKVARLTVEAARRWRNKHPGRNVMEMIPSTWRAYVKANI